MLSLQGNSCLSVGIQSGGFHFQSHNSKRAAAGTSFTWLSSERSITETYPDPQPQFPHHLGP